MPIRFICSTITHFDAERREYVRCETELCVSESNVGTYVVCTQCQQRVLVPQLSDSRLDQVAAVGAAALPEAVVAPVGSTEPSRGGVAVIRASEPTIEAGDIRLAGFQRWLSRFTHQTNAAAVVTAMHALVGLTLVIVVVLGFAGGGLGLLISLTGAAILLGLYVYALYDWRRIARQPAARLSWWQAAGWHVMLEVCRATRWRWLAGREPYKVLDVRGQQLSESQLLGRGDLTEYHVIDAEGVPLTDAGLARMKGLRRLQRLVVRGSSASREALFRLQQDLPDAWIWS
jgi:hypothetical protein